MFSRLVLPALKLGLRERDVAGATLTSQEQFSTSRSTEPSFTAKLLGLGWQVCFGSSWFTGQANQCIAGTQSRLSPSASLRKSEDMAVAGSVDSPPGCTGIRVRSTRSTRSKNGFRLFSLTLSRPWQPIPSWFEGTSPLALWVVRSQKMY